MRRITTLLALALLLVPSISRAQDPTGYVWAGGGLNMPSGDAANGLKSGFVGTVGYGWIVPSMRAWSFQAEGMFGSNDYKGASGSMSLTGFMVNVGYDFDQKADAHPYVYAGLGSLSSKPKGGSSKSNMAYQAAAGYSWKVNADWNFWAEARYLSINTSGSSTNFIPLVAGFSMAVGK